MHISWARLASFCLLGVISDPLSFCLLGVISDPLIVTKFYNETHDPKGQENKIYTIVKGRETFYRRHTVPITSCSEVKYVLKRVSNTEKHVQINSMQSVMEVGEIVGFKCLFLQCILLLFFGKTCNYNVFTPKI